MLLHDLHDGDEVVRQRAAVRVAEDEPVGPGRLRGPECVERVVAVRAEPVEEVLGVEHDLLHARPEEGDRVRDHGEVLVERRVERVRHVEVPRLADDRRDRRARVEEGLHVGVRLDGAARAPGHAERGELGVLERDVLHTAEEAEVLRVRARPPALDVVDPEGVETRRQADLVLHREGHALALGAVAERRVVDLDQATHGVTSMMPSASAGCQDSRAEPLTFLRARPSPGARRSPRG